MSRAPRVVLPDVELQRAVDALRKANVLHATIKLSDKRVLIFRGGPFGSVEITPALAQRQPRTAEIKSSTGT